MDNQFNLFQLVFQKLLKSLSNERGEVEATPPATEELTPEEQAAKEALEAGQTPPEGEEKLYAGRFKTPEELEESYKHSSQEGIRLAQENKRLQTELQQAQTPKEVAEIKEEIVDLNKHFDADTAKVISEYVDGKIKAGISSGLNNFKAESEGQTAFSKQVTEVWDETKKLYPEAADSKSNLYLRANEILFERGLAQTDASGQLRLLTPFAYRIAVEAASAELSRQVPGNDVLKGKKGRAGAIQGKAGGGTPQGKLSYEQYEKLSDEQKDAYDKSQAK